MKFYSYNCKVKMMRKILPLILGLLSVLSYAQQDPYYTHFRYNIQSYNPGAAGLNEGKICVSAIAHRQWRGYDDNTANSGTGETVNYRLTNAAPESYNLNLATQAKLAPRHVIGLGISFLNDVAAYRKVTDFNLQLNYKVQLPSIGAEIGVGPSIGARQWGFVNPRFFARQGGDPKIPMDMVSQNETKFNLGFGGFFNQENISQSFKKLFIGLSATNLTSPKYEVTTITNELLQETVVPHFYAVAGADYEINPSLLLEPTILIKAGGFKPQIDLNATVLWNDMFRGGLAYRQWGNTDAVSLLFGYRGSAKNNTINYEIGYSYDITMSRVNDVSNGSHEIMARFCFPFKTIDPKPGIIRRTPRFL